MSSINYIAIREITLLQEGNTPLHIACENGDTKTAQLLIKKGADLHKCNRVCYFRAETLYVLYVNPRLSVIK